MITPTWKLLPILSEHQTQVVWRKWENGREDSCLIDSIDYIQWLLDGNTPEPADIPEPPTYAELRAAAYPPVTDYLDAIVKGDTVQAQAYIDACLAVKAEYPK